MAAPFSIGMIAEAIENDQERTRHHNHGLPVQAVSWTFLFSIQADQSALSGPTPLLVNGNDAMTITLKVLDAPEMEATVRTRPGPAPPVPVPTAGFRGGLRDSDIVRRRQSGHGLHAVYTG